MLGHTFSTQADNLQLCLSLHFLLCRASKSATCEYLVFLKSFQIMLTAPVHAEVKFWNPLTAIFADVIPSWHTKYQWYSIHLSYIICLFKPGSVQELYISFIFCNHLILFIIWNFMRIFKRVNVGENINTHILNTLILQL